jgi:hypothetical protein
MKDNNNESSVAEEDKTPIASSLRPSTISKIIEDMMHNRITHTKKEIYKIQSIAQTERLWTEIDTDIAMGTIAAS